MFHHPWRRRNSSRVSSAQSLLPRFPARSDVAPAAHPPPRQYREVALDPSGSVAENRVDECPQFAAKPTVKWNSESPLAPSQDLTREEISDRCLQHPLTHEAPHVMPGREAQRDVEQLCVQEGRTDLEPVGHAHPVGLDQQVVEEIGAEVEIQQAIKRVGTG